MSRVSYMDVTGTTEDIVHEADPNQIDIENFSFELHTSFSSIENSIGLDLIQNLELLCHKFKLPELFVHHTQILGDKQYTKLDQASFFKKFHMYETSHSTEKSKHKQVAKVWVCGPPLMQEYFDRAQ